MAVSTRSILNLAVPIIGEQFLVFGIMLYDTAVAGNLGLVPLAAQSVVLRWVQFTTVVYHIMSVGASILVAQAIGQKQRETADACLVAALALALVSGAALALVVGLASPLLVGLLGVEPSVSALSIPYLSLIGLSFPLNFLLLTALGCVRGAGDARTPLFVLVAANLLHVALVPLLAYNAGMGLQGIALTTIVSRLLGLVIIAYLLLRGVAGLRLTRFQPRLDAMRRVWQVGSGVGGEQLALRLGQLVSLRLVALLGTQAIATFSVVTNTLSTLLTVGIGFMTATLTLVGQSVGANNYSHIHSVTWRTLYLGWVTVGGLALFCFIFPQVNALFSAEPAVLDEAALGLRIVVFSVPFELVNQVITGALRGAGDTRYPMLLTLLGQWVIRIPLIALLAALGFGLNSVWLSMLVDTGIRAALNLRRFNATLSPAAHPEARPV